MNKCLDNFGYHPRVHGKLEVGVSSVGHVDAERFSDASYCILHTVGFITGPSMMYMDKMFIKMFTRCSRCSWTRAKRNLFFMDAALMLSMALILSLSLVLWNNF